MSRCVGLRGLVKKEVRLQYSGLIVFAAKMISVATGMIFTLLITRNTSPGEYGIWANISDLVGYFVLIAGAIPFWSTRFVARNREGSTKTGLVANLIIGVISTLIYLPVVPVITSSLNVPQAYVILYFIVSAQIVEFYLINQFEAAFRAEKPQVVGYGLLIEESAKIVFAYILIVQFQQPLFGAMLSLIAAVLIQIGYYLRQTSNSLRGKIQWNYVRQWLKGSIVNIYYMIGNQIAALVLIMLFTLGSPEARADFQAAATIANIIAYSSFLSFALYPRLLAEKGLEEVTTSLKLVLMFAIPLTAGALAIPESFLIILNEPYGSAAPVLIILAVDALVTTISGFYTYVLFGVEKLDEKATIPIRQLVRSHIFKVFTLSYVHSAFTIPTTYIVLTRFAGGGAVQAATYVAAINTIGHVSMFLVLYMMIRGTVTITVPWKSIGKYSLAAGTMGSVLYIIPHPTRIALTLATVAIGGLIYLVLILAFDKEARTLIRSILTEVREKLVAP
jgi:O-antigen/teichoic acid export membrane protein